MYKFQLFNGKEARIYYSHKGGSPERVVKGKTIPAKPPKMTLCSIVCGETLLGQGWSKPVREVAELVAPEDHSHVQNIYGKRLLRTMWVDFGDSGEMVAILRGDNFCRKTGRRESLAKALEASGLSKENRASAWEAINAPERAKALRKALKTPGLPKSAQKAWMKSLGEMKATE
jgi:hypothetical protein